MPELVVERKPGFTPAVSKVLGQDIKGFFASPSLIVGVLFKLLLRKPLLQLPQPSQRKRN